MSNQNTKHAADDGHYETESERRERIKGEAAYAKRQIDAMSWKFPITLRLVGPFGRAVIVCDVHSTVEAIMDWLGNEKVRSGSYAAYASRASDLVTSILFQKIDDALHELVWEVGELILMEDIFEGLNVNEARQAKQDIPSWFLKASKFAADSLRKRRWLTTQRGMRGRDRKPRKTRALAMRAHELNRLRVLRAINMVRSLSEDEQDEILNNKKKLAAKSGMSYSTLRRSERQGGWSAEGLIADSSKHA